MGVEKTNITVLFWPKFLLSDIVPQVKEKLKTSNYMMDPPKNYLRQKKKMWDALYNLMKECWYRNPKQRPKFKTLVKDLDTIMSEKKTFSKEKKREAWSRGTLEEKSFDSLTPVKSIQIPDYDI